ncbi:MAG: hypothetical protein ACNA7V_09815 [Bacteroidales bacterium]
MNTIVPVTRPVKVLIIVCLVATILSCAKEKETGSPQDPSIEDWRKVFEGTYKFSIYKTIWWMLNEPPWGAYLKDTIVTEGSIEIFGKNQLLIKYTTGTVYGLFVNDTLYCNSMSICMIPDSLLDNPSPPYYGLDYWSYYETWASPVIRDDKTLRFHCIPFNPEPGGLHETFGGYFTGNDSVYFGYSSGGLGAGSYTDIYGVKIQD